MNTYYEYALGYYDGRAEGVYNNPYEDREMSHAYRLGYDKGVADYCHYELDEYEHIEDCPAVDGFGCNCDDIINHVEECGK